jgi:hypothetical protein
MNGSAALRALAQALGIHLEYVDGLGRQVVVSEETLLRLCAAMGAPVFRLEDCPVAWAAHQARPASPLPPVVVAWDGVFRLPPSVAAHVEAMIELESGEALSLVPDDPDLELTRSPRCRRGRCCCTPPRARRG